MRKIILIFSLLTLSFAVYSEEIKVEKSLEDSITKDYDQDGVYSSYEKALRRGQESVYVKLPERRGYWYTMLDRIKAEEEELMPDEINRMRKR
ncbi:hypothetical protein [Sebaldella sp. S0638]|uniref:hypothetical protein n=1 Tax=Sebaldella sp. S0638 TaxID=2957809 RepID=UPI0020A03C8C|nr:hypothetical protein [Sebaldella sp. S0638]MCP1225266.1 hypothetical protein [Sebaldella sp. S0638]